MNKPILRAHLRATRDAFTPTAFPLPQPLLARLTPGTVVASYIAIGSEADPRSIAAVALERGCRLALPHVTTRIAPLRFLAWNGDDAALVPGTFGLRQPATDLPEVTPDIILTPLLGFDRRGNRLGQGAGHYDRAFIAQPTAWRVGIAWSVQQIDALTPDSWDVPLHAIATERDWITP